MKETPSASLTGERVGHYSVLEEIGRGGMGVVYRARDEKLGRDVAIKVLPPDLVEQEARRSRFEREARLLASLNHPNIAAIYGIESAESLLYLVLELVPGETLAERIQREPLPAEEVLRLALQIAEALDAAHESGVIHRDLKPANVKVTEEGQVKLLDFGLGKTLEPEPSSDPVLSDSPTLTAAATREGIILGTAPYMSPEQARGRPVDKRTDIFSFGVMMYEMLSGQRAFSGEDVSDILAAVIRAEPDWNALPQSCPRRIRKLLQGCMAKDRRQRRRDMGDVHTELEEIATERGDAQTPVSETAAPSENAKLALVGAVALVLGGTLAGLTAWNVKPPSPRRVVRLPLVLPADRTLETERGLGLALSPDGERLIYSARSVDENANIRQLYLHDMAVGEATPIDGTRGAESPFLSPDGAWLGFWIDRDLTKLALSGGAPIVLAETAPASGAHWSDDDTIVYGTSEGIWQIPAAGGAPVALATIDEGVELIQGPRMLPGGEAVLFTFATGLEWDNASIEVLRLATGERRTLIEGGADARYASTGHLVYALGSSLLAVGFDLEQLEIIGSPVPVVENVGRPLSLYSGAADFDFSESGNLVYEPAGAVTERRLVLVDRSGKATPLTEDRRTYQWVRLSPEGDRLALQIEERGKSDVWVYDIERDGFSRLTRVGHNAVPSWSPDGRSVAFSSDRAGDRDLYRARVDGSSPPERLLDKEHWQSPMDWSPDGAVIIYQENHPDTERDVWMLPVASAGENEPRALLRTDASERLPSVSPDGKWLAFTASPRLSDQSEVYVQPFPESGERWQVSTDGGYGGRWSPDGRELFYVIAGRMMVVDVTTEPSFRTSAPRVLFEMPDYWSIGGSYEIMPDGEHFVMIWGSEEAPPLAGRRLTVVINWFAELERLAPRGDR